MNTHDRRPERYDDDPHVEDVIEDVNGDALDADDPITEALGATLRAALAPPTDVRSSARRKVDRTLHVRSATSLLSSMGACGIETMRHLLTNPVPGADRYSMSGTHRLAELGNDDIDNPAGTPPGERGMDRKCRNDSGAPR